MITDREVGANCKTTDKSAGLFQFIPSTVYSKMKPHLINNLEQKVLESYEATLMSKLFRDDFAIDNLQIKMRWFLLLGCLTVTVPYDILMFVSEKNIIPVV